MGQTTIKQGQSWWDVGIELSGAWEAGIDLALSHGLSMSEPPPTGQEVKCRKTYDRPMELYCHAEGVSPATLYDLDHSEAGYQIFSPVFNTTFR